MLDSSCHYMTSIVFYWGHDETFNLCQLQPLNCPVMQMLWPQILFPFNPTFVKLSEYFTFEVEHILCSNPFCQIALDQRRNDTEIGKIKFLPVNKVPMQTSFHYQPYIVLI